jgi:predicted helicase
MRIFPPGTAIDPTTNAKVKKRTLRLHQKRAIKNSVAQFLTNNEGRGKLIHPCGDHLQLSVTTP